MSLTVEVVQQVLQHRGYPEKNRTKKKVAYQYGQALPLYLNLQSKKGTSVLVAHPQSGVEVMQGQGIGIGGEYFHSSNMSLFPKHMHTGATPIAYGIGLTFDSTAALERCLAFLEQGQAALQTQQAPVAMAASVQANPAFSPEATAVPLEDEVASGVLPAPARATLSHEPEPMLESESEPVADWDKRSLLPGQDVLVQTTRRVGHDGFRRALEAYWEGACAITGVRTTALLRASHIKPWAACEPEEQTSVFNGLLLAAHWDAAFDRGLITLDVHGAVVFSPQLSEADASVLGMVAGQRLRRPLQPQHLPYLAHHRQHVFLAD